MQFDGTGLRFVLSPGRTGTTLLREYLKKYYQRLTIWFEPPPSRELYLLWNAEQAGFVPKSTSVRLLKRIKLSSLKKESKEIIVEFDSYLSPLVCELLPYVRSPIVIHLIRHPYDWIQSMGNFRAASWRKYAVDIVPFTYIVHPAVKNIWRKLDKIQKLAWFWRLVNERILQQKLHCEHYGLFKFEDLVSHDRYKRMNSLKGILSLINPDCQLSVPDIDINNKVNKSEDDYFPEWQKWPIESIRNVNDICEELVALFDYKIQE